MSNNRFNKVPDYTPREKKKVEEPTVDLKPCCVCSKVITGGYYGRWSDGGSCNRDCDSVMQDSQLLLKDIP